MDFELPYTMLWNKNFPASMIVLLICFCLPCRSLSLGNNEVPFNLNEYIAIAPSNYFVKVLFSSLLSENFGPSNTPLTLVSYNKSENLYARGRSWCRFLPGQLFIEARTENTLNLVVTDLNICYQYSNYDASEPNKCDILGFAVGGFYVRSKTGGNCKVTTDRMYTLILAETFRRDMITKDITGFWSRFQLKLFPYSIFIFYSINRHAKKICSFTFPTDQVTLNCFDFRIVTYQIFYHIPVGSKSWTTSGNVKHWAQMTEAGTLSGWDWYFQKAVEEILIFEILKKANETGQVNYFSKARIEQLYEWQMLNKPYVLVDNFKIAFLSCYSEKQVEFGMYYKPFSFEVWACLLVCLTCIAAIMYVQNRQNHLSTNFSPLFFLLSSLLEDSYPIPDILLNTKIYKIFVLTWLLPTVVLTNLYTGLVISDVTSPLRGNILKSFDEIFEPKWNTYTPLTKDITETLNFWKLNYSKSSGTKYMINPLQEQDCMVPFDSKSFDLYQQQFRSKQSFALLQMPIENCGGNQLSYKMQQRYLSHPWMYSEFGNLFDELVPYLLATMKRTKHIRNLLAFFSPGNRHYPRDPMFSSTGNQTIAKYTAFAVEKELVACKRSVFVGKTYDLKFELSYLKSNYARNKFYVSKGSFETDGSKPVVWSFRDGGKSMVAHHFKRIFEAGVRNGIISLRKHKSYLQRRVGTGFVHEAISNEANPEISGSIQTVFYITLASLSIANMVFLAEFSFSKQMLSSKIWIILCEKRIVPNHVRNTLRSLVIRFRTIKPNISSKKQFYTKRIFVVSQSDNRTIVQ
jgi:hypothetical protein